MTPLPGALGGAGLVGWRINKSDYASTWDSGIGAEMSGGRWNHPGTKVVYAALDPATTILEVAVHLGFPLFDVTAHTMTEFEILDPADVYVVKPADIPNPAWLQSSIPSRGQRDFGQDLILRHSFVVLPSAVSKESWNVLFNPAQAVGRYRVRQQEAFALDTRLNPAT